MDVNGPGVETARAGWTVLPLAIVVTIAKPFSDEEGDMSAHTAIVTGGARGIGRAVVERLHRDGAQVLTCGRSADPGDLPPGVRWVRADIARTEDAERVTAEADAAFGPVSLLVNNAGVQLEKTVADTTDDDWDLVVGVNCRGVFTLCRAVLPQMCEHGGVIVNVGSTSASVADPTLALYNASKAFVHGLTRSIAVDHGPSVRCNAVAPGWVTTGMSEDAFALARDPETARRDALARLPVGRFGQPEDIANTVAWLASDEAQYVTGQIFTLDGGLTAASPLNPGLF
jgi:NAD(P)-dependent dehydrogenase (short-subunit alcohol dehydrogenase family)